LRWKPDGDRGVRHIDLISLILEQRPHLMPFVSATTDFSFDNLRDEIMGLSSVACIIPISEARCDAICSVIADRLTLIRSLIQ
jgi:hypothetical protein